MHLRFRLEVQYCVIFVLMLDSSKDKKSCVFNLVNANYADDIHGLGLYSLKRRKIKLLIDLMAMVFCFHLDFVIGNSRYS